MTATGGGGGGGGGGVEALVAQLGHFRLYQRWVLALVCVPNVLGAMYTLNYVFVADRTLFRCALPECGEGGAAGGNYGAEWAWALLPADAPCDRYAPRDHADGHNATTCGPHLFDSERTQPCDNFLYADCDTVFSEFDLACREWRRTLVGTVRNSALPLALLLTGYLSDWWGRRTAFCVSAFFAGWLGIIKSFAPNYRVYISLEFFEAALGYGFNGAAYVLVLELARPSLRSWFACATGVAYGLGGMLLAATAYAVPNWRHLLRTVHAPALLLPLYWLLLDESPRWLATRGRFADATRVLRKAARWNGVTLDENALSELEKTTEMSAQTTGKSAGGADPWRRLVRSRALMMRLALCSCCWAATSFVYYGLTINSVSLSERKHIDFALNMLMEVVASLLLAMALERFGRRKSILAALVTCGLTCVLSYFISHGSAGLGLFLAGKLAVTFAFNGLYIHTTELFPTETRSSALSACSLVGRVGSILAPQTPLLNVYAQAALFGGVALGAAVLLLLAPETRRTPLPDTAAAAAALGRPPPAAPPAPPAPPTPVAPAPAQAHSSYASRRNS